AHGAENDSDDIAEDFENLADEIEPAQPDTVQSDTAQSDEMRALAEAISADFEPLEEQPDTSGESMASSLRPQSRPSDLRNIHQTAAAAPAPAAASGGKEMDPDSIAIGTRLAQLGAFSS